MATLLLAAAGSAIGGAFGATAGLIGQAAGAVAGAYIDSWLFGSRSNTEVGRLADLSVQSSTEGAPIPRLYGRMRIAGEVIWATDFTETASTESAGTKGSGSTVTTYSYTADFAVGLCEGPIAHIGRVWANGELLDLTRVTMRVHTGSEDQEPDSLILAMETAAPAYRGLAYVVFEGLPLDDFGNALPQLSFEVIRPVGRLEQQIRAVTLIPGATEFGYATSKVTRRIARGETGAENRHAATASSDLAASLDELQALCPALESVAVVVTWFGSDLRAGVCTLKPKVERSDKTTTGLAWTVAGLTRATAGVVSATDGAPAFGGTPSDASVVELIAALKARGLAVTFYPFIMMDVPAGNSLPDPYGGSAQATYPWRGRITCHPAKGVSGSVWGSAAVATQVASFLGTAAPDNFTLSGTTVVYSGSADWGYRRMILHYAKLCAAADGVDCFLIGSELRGLTTLRATGRTYPFVSALVTLAGEVKTMLGSSTEVSYAADWSEWNGHQAGTGDFAFHLDPLWASSSVDFVGIDAYFPLSDWRDGTPADAATSTGPLDPDYLAANVAGGEGYDWYYASDAARLAGTRSAITDGLGKPWLYRYKDIAGWWGNRHYDRTGGAEQASPSAWIAGMKPVRFTEIGCPAVDRGGNEPNVFPDTVSSEGKAPWFSHGRRDDAAQRRYLEALIGHFDPEGEDFVAADNPLSPLDGRRMVDMSRAHVWTWDARPYPWFPLATDVWSDGGNWQTGHWLTGRLGAAPLREVIEAIAADAGLDGIDAARLTPVLDGLVLTDRGSPRRLIETLAAALRFEVTETADGLRFADRPLAAGASLVLDDLVTPREGAEIDIRRADAADIPGELAVAFLDSESDGLSGSVAARRDGASGSEDVSLPVAAAASVMQAIADAWLIDREAGRETVTFHLPPEALAHEPGDIVTLATGTRTLTLSIRAIEDGDSRKVEARTVETGSGLPAAGFGSRSRAPALVAAIGAPEVLLLDLPARDGDSQPWRPYVAAASEPWPGRMTVHRKTGDSYAAVATLARPAVIGTLNAALGAGRLWRIDGANSIDVTLVRGTLSGIADAALLEGGNLAAIGSMAGGWEVLQFRTATLIGTRRYRLEGLLRGQGGTEALATAGHAAGVDFVLLDGAVIPLPMTRTQVGRSLTLQVGNSRRAVGSDELTTLTLTPAAVGLKPLAPVHLAGRRDFTSGDVVFSWVRRTRTGGDDFESVEVPLGESTEAYELDVMSGATVLRTLTAATAAVTYGAAAQIADFGSLPSAIDIAVAQLSDTLGRGRLTRSTINV